MSQRAEELLKALVAAMDKTADEIGFKWNPSYEQHLANARAYLARLGRLEGALKALVGTNCATCMEITGGLPPEVAGPHSYVCAIARTALEPEDKEAPSGD